MMHSFRAVARGEESASKKLSAPERQARLEGQCVQQSGLDISGPLEPTQALYNLCAGKVEKNEVMYISTSECLSPQQSMRRRSLAMDLQGSKKCRKPIVESKQTGIRQVSELFTSSVKAAATARKPLDPYVEKWRMT